MSAKGKVLVLCVLLYLVSQVVYGSWSLQFLQGTVFSVRG